MIVRMRIFLDTASLVEIRRWNRQRVIDGVTTNPSILYQAGFHDLKQAACQIAAEFLDHAQRSEAARAKVEKEVER